MENRSGDEQNSKIMDTPVLRRSAISQIAARTGLRRASSRMTIRQAVEADIDALVEVDVKAFERVYSKYQMRDEELREDLHKQFSIRFQRLGGRWISLIEIDGHPVGFMMCCPTSKRPEDFESWEDATDNGTLTTTYDPAGEYLYVVSLSVVPAASRAQGQDMLIMSAIGQLIETRKRSAFFESRLPGLKTWTKLESRREGRQFEKLTQSEKGNYASEYFHSTLVVSGKEVPRDPLLRLFAGVGCRFIKLVPDAYRDEPSMNFGAIGIFDNPLPAVFRTNVMFSAIAGKAVQLAARSKRLANALFA